MLPSSPPKCLVNLAGFDSNRSILFSIIQGPRLLFYPPVLARLACVRIFFSIRSRKPLPFYDTQHALSGNLLSHDHRLVSFETAYLPFVSNLFFERNVGRRKIPARDSIATLKRYRVGRLAPGGRSRRNKTFSRIWNR